MRRETFSNVSCDTASLLYGTHYKGQFCHFGHAYFARGMTMYSWQHVAFVVVAPMFLLGIQIAFESSVSVIVRREAFPPW